MKSELSKLNNINTPAQFLHDNYPTLLASEQLSLIVFPLYLIFPEWTPAMIREFCLVTAAVVVVVVVAVVGPGPGGLSMPPLFDRAETRAPAPDITEDRDDLKRGD